jgi:hypothetical protein
MVCPFKCGASISCDGQVPNVRQSRGSASCLQAAQWAAWRAICVANAGEPVNITAATAHTPAIDLRRIALVLEVAWVMAELLFGLAIGDDRFCGLR